MTYCYTCRDESARPWETCPYGDLHYLAESTDPEFNHSRGGHNEWQVGCKECAALVPMFDIGLHVAFHRRINRLTDRVGDLQ